MASANSCLEHIDRITASKAVYQLLFYLNPVNTSVWQERTEAWNYFFIAVTALYSFFFFMIGLASVVLIIKKDCLRLKTKTFLGIYTCLAVLGFSRGLFLALDPYGILGWLMSRFDRWTIASRSLAALGFPSLTASYTLVFLTLYKAPEINSSRHWHRQLRIVLAVMLTQYAIAVVAEVVANVAPYPAVVTVLACDAFFCFWGVTICVVYIFAGSRLLHKLKERYAHGTSSPRLERGVSRGFLSEELERKYNEKIAAAFRKIGLITYCTAILGILYSVVSFANLASTTTFAFYLCFGFTGMGDPNVWIVFRVGIFSLEIPLAIVMLYSVTDFASVMCCKRSNRTSCIHQDSRPTMPGSKSKECLSTSQSTQISLVSLELASLSDKISSTSRPVLKMIVHTNTDSAMELQVPV